MAFTTITKSTDYFNTKLYSGTGSAQNITGVGFQPDFTWIKDRTNANSHMLVDAVRGATKVITSDANYAETTDANRVSAFTADGFNVGTNNNVNQSGANVCSWNWKEHVNSGFDIVTWTGNGSARTIAHSLNKVPTMIMIKDLSAATDWTVYHVGVGNTKRLRLNDTGAEEDDASFFNDTTPTSSVFSVGTSSAVNLSGRYYVGYVFTDIVGFSKMGSFVGNGNANGSFIYCGFKPVFIMTKKTTATGRWSMRDATRDPFNVASRGLAADASNSENTGSGYWDVDLNSNGFKLRTTEHESNGANLTFIYMAFGQSLVGSNDVPCTAR